MFQHDIADRNVERLLGVAYKPEPIDPAFLLETQEKLLAAARDERRTQQASPADTAKLLRIRRRMGWAMAAAAAVAGYLLASYAHWTPQPQHAQKQIGLPWFGAQLKDQKDPPRGIANGAIG